MTGRLRRVHAALCVAALLARAAPAQPRLLTGTGAQHARASIASVGVSPHGAQVLVTLAIDPGWHVSWRNPGETGLPTRLTWSLPTGVRVHDETWPVPVIAHTAVGATHTLEGEVPWIVEFDVDSVTRADRLIALTMSYGICREVCIPERLTVQGVLPGRAARVVAIPVGLKARLAQRGAPVAARRRSPTQLCLAHVPLATAAGAPEIIADSGLALDAAVRLTAKSHAKDQVFLMEVPSGVMVRDGVRVLVVQGVAAVATTLDFRAPAPGCTARP